MAAGLVGVLREAARLESSAEAFAEWSLTFCATGPAQTCRVSVSLLAGRRHGDHLDAPLVTESKAAAAPVGTERSVIAVAGRIRVVTCQKKKSRLAAVSFVAQAGGLRGPRRPRTSPVLVLSSREPPLTAAGASAVSAIATVWYLRARSAGVCFWQVLRTGAGCAVGWWTRRRGFRSGGLEYFVPGRRGGNGLVSGAAGRTRRGGAVGGSY